jgi:hypothetical protein
VPVVEAAVPAIRIDHLFTAELRVLVVEVEAVELIELELWVPQIPEEAEAEEELLAAL